MGLARSDTYRLPAEWEIQEAVWLTWPQNRETWGNMLPKVEEFYVNLCGKILDHQDIYLLVDNNHTAETIRNRIGDCYPFKLHLVEKKTNDCWIRDYGGITVVKEDQRFVLNWKFNSWGEKYPPWHDDDKTPDTMAEIHGIEKIDPAFVLEGGSIDGNGKGVLLTAEPCLLLENRNPGVSKVKMEKVLFQYLGAEEVIWLQSGIPGDDTDGHVDNLARFVNERTIFCMMEKNRSEQHYTVIRNNLKQLEVYAWKAGMEIVEIPFPPAMFVNSLRTPASYANFLVINGAVLVPTFSVKTDESVLSCFADYFPGRTIIPVDCRRLSYGQGGVHCIAMQVPKCH
jgi:agmatine deiminase